MLQVHGLARSSRPELGRGLVCPDARSFQRFRLTGSTRFPRRSNIRNDRCEVPRLPGHVLGFACGTPCLPRPQRNRPRVEFESMFRAAYLEECRLYATCIRGLALPCTFKVTSSNAPNKLIESSPANYFVYLFNWGYGQANATITHQKPLERVPSMEAHGHTAIAEALLEAEAYVGPSGEWVEGSYPLKGKPKRGSLKDTKRSVGLRTPRASHN